MRFTFPAALIVVALATAAQAGQSILTIAGPDVAPNRDAVTQETPGFFKYHEVTFENGAALDLEALEAMGMREIIGKLPGTDLTVAYSGPPLMDVLKATRKEGSGALPEIISVMALDGYAADIAVADIEAHNAILATRVDGEPMGIGDLGPTMVVFEMPDDAEKAGTLGDAQVWSAFFIRVQ
ncbi:MAG: hypothetical protein AAF661_03905 [Pseudomonadota bacterium]